MDSSAKAILLDRLRRELNIAENQFLGVGLAEIDVCQEPDSGLQLKLDLSG